MKVLVVDDQELNRTLLQFLLEEDGYEVVIAANGLEAIECFDDVLPDLVLLDVVMPVMDGFATAPVLKKKAGELYLPIIFITALDDQASLKRCLEVGGDDFLNKPFDKVILSAKIRAHARIRALSYKTLEQKIQLEYHQNQINREHEIVDHVFKNALQDNIIDTNVINFYLSPHSMFNGDVLLVTPNPVGGIYMLMGDFTGHGLSAAIGALPLSKTFYSMAKKGLSVGDMAGELNSQLLQLLPDDMFCAATILEMNSSGKSISLWIGGMPDTFLLNRDGSMKKIISSQHMALGVLDEGEFENTVMNIETSPGERVITYTDGIIESVNMTGEMYGEPRFEAFYQVKKDTSIDCLIDELVAFRGEAEQNDDISVAYLTCTVKQQDDIEPTHQFSLLPFKISVNANAHALKATDPVVEVLDVISNIIGLSDHRSVMFLLLSEIFNNALDHGILKLDSSDKDLDDGFMDYYFKRQDALACLDHGDVTIEVDYKPIGNQILFIITDSGDGFELSATSDNTVNNKEHGRGLSLLNELAESIEYSDKGNQVTITYSLEI
ncbi:MAG: CheY-like chemotaxis protein [Alteromonadaceae bacterium]|jgi:CheY-like chemotaxis protein